MELVKFDTNEYQGDEIDIGGDLPVDSEYYSIKYIEKYVDNREFKENISTEGITDIIVKIKDTIIKLLDWIYDKITSFINYIKEFFYNLDKTIDVTIHSLNRCEVMRNSEDLLRIKNKPKFRLDYKASLYISNDIKTIMEYVSTTLPKTIIDILNKCDVSLNSDNTIVELYNLILIKNCCYWDKINYTTIGVDNTIVNKPLPKITDDINIKISVEQTIEYLERIKEDNKIKEIEDMVARLKEKYKKVKKEVINKTDNDLTNVLNNIKLIGVNIPMNVLKTYIILIKECVDIARTLSSDSYIGPNDLIWAINGKVGYNSGRRF